MTHPDARAALALGGLDEVLAGGNDHVTRMWFEYYHHTIKNALTQMIDGGWNSDMDAAPRDGTEIDLWFNDGGHPYRITGAKWMDGGWYHYSLDNSAGYGELDWVDACKYPSPTHWRYPPSPPQENNHE